MYCTYSTHLQRIDMTRPMRLPRLATALLAAVVVASACSSSPDGPQPVTLPEGAETTSTATEAASDTTTSSTTSTTSTTITEAPAAADVAAVEALWAQVISTAAANPTNTAQLDGITSTGVAEQLEALIPDDGSRVVESYAAVTDAGDGTASIEDCAIFDRPISTSVAIWFSATASVDDAGTWSITSFGVNSLDGCVPAELAGPVLAGYLDHWSARDDFLDPPNPDSPRLTETTTGRQLETWMEVSTMLRDDGQRFVSVPAEQYPEFVAVNSSTNIEVLDCQLTNPEQGVYDIASGDRTDLVPPVTDGQRDALQTIMVLEDGIWKVENNGAERGIECQHAPTSAGIPVVPAIEEQ